MASTPDYGARDVWTWIAREPAPTENERALYNQFCQEYMADGDVSLAAMRCGFTKEFAEECGNRMYGTSYVQKELRRLREVKPDPEVEKEYDTRIAMNTLREIASNRFASSASRVAAAKALAEIHGVSAGGAEEETATEKGGVIMVPAIANIDAWQAAASESQTKLASASRVD